MILISQGMYSLEKTRSDRNGVRQEITSKGGHIFQPKHFFTKKMQIRGNWNILWIHINFGKLFWQENNQNCQSSSFRHCWKKTCPLSDSPGDSGAIVAKNPVVKAFSSSCGNPHSRAETMNLDLPHQQVTQSHLLHRSLAQQDKVWPTERRGPDKNLVGPSWEWERKGGGTAS